MSVHGYIPSEAQGHRIGSQSVRMSDIRRGAQAKMVGAAYAAPNTSLALQKVLNQCATATVRNEIQSSFK